MRNETLSLWMALAERVTLVKKRGGSDLAVGLSNYDAIVVVFMGVE